MALSSHCFWCILHTLFKLFFWLGSTLNLVNNMDVTLLTFKYLIFTVKIPATVSLLLYVRLCFLIFVLHKLPCFFGVTLDFFSVSVYFCIPLCSDLSFHIWWMFCHMLGTEPVGVSFYNIHSSLLLFFPLHSSSCGYFQSVLVSTYFFLPSQSLLHLMFANTAFCDPCASTLWVQANTCSLLTLLISCGTINSLIILAVMASSLMLLINCSFSLLSLSLYLQSAAFTHNLPIHSYMDSWFSYLVDTIVTVI